jgi:hypothetical protein
MLSHNSKHRMKLRPSLRRYWPFLLGIALFHLLVIFVPGVLESHKVLFVLFLVAVVPAGWPHTFGTAPYTFWLVACCYWFFGFMLMAIVRVLVGEAFNLDS